MKNSILILTNLTILTGLCNAVVITVDYRYDTNNFFTAARKTSLEAAATRWSNVLDNGNLNSASIQDDNIDGRIGFSHPGTGVGHQVSGATDQTSDSLVTAGAPVASEYRSISWQADEWILYAGGRDTTSIGGPAGIGGTGTGTNFTSVASDPNSHLNRGFNGSTNPVTLNLPTWGGAITFNTSSTWQLDGDLYTVALHEIGHALGLASSWDNNANNITTNSDRYVASNALNAYNADNGTSLTSLTIVDGTTDPNHTNAFDSNPNNDNNYHWEDGTQKSNIFEEGNPDYTDTVGQGNLQDLLMEPTANFTPAVSRFELTNVDVGAAEDIGWIVIPEPSSTLLLGLGSLTLLARRRK